MFGSMTEMQNSELLMSIAMSDPKYLSGKGKVIDNDKPVEGLKGKFVSEPKDFKDYSVPLMTEEFKKNYAAELKEKIIKERNLNREWAKDHLEVIM